MYAPPTGKFRRRERYIYDILSLTSRRVDELLRHVGKSYDGMS